MSNEPSQTLPVEQVSFRLFQANQQRLDGLSSSLQVSKAAEHLVCAELLLQGWNAFLADAGLPYDVLVDLGSGRMCRVQVKATTRMYEWRVGPGSAYRAGHPHYRFALRRSRTGDRRITLDGCDHLALVALDRKLIAWMTVAAIKGRAGYAKSLIGLKTRQMEYTKYGNTGTDPNKVGRFMEDYAVFCPSGR